MCVVLQVPALDMSVVLALYPDFVDHVLFFYEDGFPRRLSALKVTLGWPEEVVTPAPPAGTTARPLPCAACVTSLSRKRGREQQDHAVVNNSEQFLSMVLQRWGASPASLRQLVLCLTKKAELPADLLLARKESKAEPKSTLRRVYSTLLAALKKSGVHGMRRAKDVFATLLPEVETEEYPSDKKPWKAAAIVLDHLTPLLMAACARPDLEPAVVAAMKVFHRPDVPPRETVPSPRPSLLGNNSCGNLY